MTTSTTHATPRPGLPIDEVMALLKSAAEAVPASRRIVRVQLPIDDLDSLAWLQAQKDFPKIYWRDREHTIDMAGLGIAHAVSDTSPEESLFANLRDNLSSGHPDLRYYGGLSFSPVSDPVWGSFGMCSFVIPRFEILRKDGATVFACNWLRQHPDAPAAELEALKAQLHELIMPDHPQTQSPPVFLSRQDLPDKTSWIDAVNQILDAVKCHELDKVVLARATYLELQGSTDPFQLIDRLRPQADNAYLFCFQPSPDEAFLSMSPERLFKCTAGFVQSEALAGTCPHTNSEAEDTQLGQALLHNEKNLREHRFVVDAIRQAFDTVCSQVHADDGLSLAIVADCQHLVARIEGILAQPNTDFDLLKALHPTPAVGGLPVNKALDFIQRLEPFGRGWYAGPIGWLGYDASEFVPGIRAARIDGHIITLYAGAGIVTGSDPEAEWDELETKIGAYLRVLE